MINNVKNPGKYKHQIKIVNSIKITDEDGFKSKIEEKVVLEPYAEVKTTRGFTLIANNTDFEKAYTKFTIRYPKLIQITRNMFVLYNDKKYSIEYLNNIDEANIELEIQAKLVRQ